MHFTGDLPQILLRATRQPRGRLAAGQVCRWQGPRGSFAGKPAAGKPSHLNLDASSRVSCVLHIMYICVYICMYICMYICRRNLTVTYGHHVSSYCAMRAKKRFSIRKPWPIWEIRNVAQTTFSLGCHGSTPDPFPTESASKGVHPADSLRTQQTIRMT